MAVSIPYTFTSGSVIQSAQVNANFAALSTAIDTGGGGTGGLITTTSPLTINPTGTLGPLLRLNATAAAPRAQIFGYRDGVPFWELDLLNISGDFSISRYTSPTTSDNPLWIERATGKVHLSVPLEVASGGTGLTSLPTHPPEFSAPDLNWDYWSIRPFLCGDTDSVEVASGGHTNWMGETIYGAVGLWGRPSTSVSIVGINNLPYLVSARAQGTPTAPTPPTAGIHTFDLAAGAYLGLIPGNTYGDHWDTWIGYLSFVADETYSPGSHATHFEIATFGPGVGGAPWYNNNHFLFGGDGSLTAPGQFKSPYSSIAAPSDPRLKKDVQPFTRGLTDLVKLEPCTYLYNGRAHEARDDGRRCIGLEAEKVQAILPELVGTMRVKLDPQPMQKPDVRNPDVKSQVPDTDVLTLNSGDLTFVLINAVKQLAARVEALEKA